MCKVSFISLYELNCGRFDVLKCYTLNYFTEQGDRFIANKDITTPGLYNFYNSMISVIFMPKAGQIFRRNYPPCHNFCVTSSDARLLLKRNQFVEIPCEAKNSCKTVSFVIRLWGKTRPTKWISRMSLVLSNSEEDKQANKGHSASKGCRRQSGHILCLFLPTCHLLFYFFEAQQWSGRHLWWRATTVMTAMATTTQLWQHRQQWQQQRPKWPWWWQQIRRLLSSFSLWIAFLILNHFIGILLVTSWTQKWVPHSLEKTNILLKRKSHFS